MNKTAVLFPRQGTQVWGMGKELYNTYTVAKAVFDEADKLLGFSFSKKLFETDSTEIMDTEIIQVAIFLTSVAYYRVFIEGSDILPRQMVISGRKGALKSAGERFEAAGAKTKMLEVKTAFPKGKVYCNVTGKAYKSVDEIYEYLPIQVR